jgi:hypothetical protein
MYSAQSSGGGGPRETRVARCSLKRSCKSVDEGFTKGVEAGSGVPVAQSSCQHSLLHGGTASRSARAAQLQLVPDLDPCFLLVARGVPVNGDWLLNQDVSVYTHQRQDTLVELRHALPESNRDGLFIVDLPLTRASASGIGRSGLSAEHSGQISSFVYFKRDLRNQGRTYCLSSVSGMLYGEQGQAQRKRARRSVARKKGQLIARKLCYAAGVSNPC